MQNPPMAKKDYYHKSSAREIYWINIIARVVLAVIALFGAMVVQVFILRRLLLEILPFEEHDSFLSAFLSWQFMLFPTIIAVIVFFSPDALKNWFHGKNESNLKEIKELSIEDHTSDRAVKMRNRRR